MSEDQKEEGGGDQQPAVISAGKLQELMADPSKLSAFSEKMAAYINSSVTIKSLPRKIRHRVKALKRIQLETTQLEADFYKEVQQLEAKYQLKYQPLYDKRKLIVCGSYEPTDEESHWSADEEDEEEEEEEEEEEGQQKKGEVNGEASSSQAAAATKDDDICGIPQFWLTALRNTDLFEDMIKEHDVPALESLIDLKVVYLDDTGLDFKIEFHFSENEFFTNSLLTKTYSVTCRLNDQEPLSYDGATLYACKGCKIDWKKGKNLTIKVIKKKQKHKGGKGGSGGQSRTITKTVPNESFFNFFCPPDAEQKGASNDEDVSQALGEDFVRAEFIRDRLVPKAVLFFTGEAMEEDDYEEDDEEDEDDDEEDEDYDAQQDVQTNKPPECKAQ